MTATRLLARPMLASIFVVGSVNALKNASSLSARAKPVIDQVRPRLEKVIPQAKALPQDPEMLVRINAGIQLAAAIALARGKAPRLSSGVLAATLVPTTAAGHAFWNETDPAARANHKVHFFKNVATLGGLMLASVDTEGRPGVAWRARNAASGVRREARHLGREAKLEARLAAKSLGQ